MSSARRQTIETCGSGDFAVPCDVIGSGAPALLLPALSSISTREEMRPLAERLSGRLRCLVPDWPGFGWRARAPFPLSPAELGRFLDGVVEQVGGPFAIGVAAGHAATYLVMAARRHPDRFGQLVLIAPTWRGPLPTMTAGRRPRLCRQIRSVLERPGIGHLLFSLNVSRPVVGSMMRAHVYADPANVTGAVLAAKLAVARRPGGRFGTAAFVSGGLDPVASREEFLALFGADLPPILMLRPRGAPMRSGAEMDALSATGLVRTVAIGGALAAHEEVPDEVSLAIASVLSNG